jgi:hypothetical protein
MFFMVCLRRFKEIVSEVNFFLDPSYCMCAADSEKEYCFVPCSYMTLIINTKNCVGSPLQRPSSSDVALIQN